MLRVVRGDGEADLLADGEPARRVEQRDRRRLEGILGGQCDAAVVASALKGGARRTADGEVPLEEVAVERRRVEVGVWARLGNLWKCSSSGGDLHDEFLFGAQFVWKEQKKNGERRSAHLSRLAHDALHGGV